MLHAFVILICPKQEKVPVNSKIHKCTVGKEMIKKNCCIDYYCAIVPTPFHMEHVPDVLYYHKTDFAWYTHTFVKYSYRWLQTMTFYCTEAYFYSVDSYLASVLAVCLVQTWENLNYFHDPEFEFDKFPQMYAIHDNSRAHKVCLKHVNLSV